MTSLPHRPGYVAVHGHPEGEPCRTTSAPGVGGWNVCQYQRDTTGERWRTALTVALLLAAVAVLAMCFATGQDRACERLQEQRSPRAADVCGERR